MFDDKNYYKMIEMTLPNIKDFFNSLSSGQKITALAFEIREIHQISARLGYEFTARFMIDIANHICKMIRGLGVLYRIEGTVFLISFNNHNDELIYEIHDKLVKYFKKLTFNEHVFSLEISSGAIVNFKNETADQYKILSTITMALDKAKKENLDLAILDENNFENNSLMVKKLEAIKNSIVKNFKGFYLVYQPFVSSMNGKVIGAEALLRWENEEYGNVAPGAFIPYIEDFSCYYDLGLWIIKTALTDTKKIIKDKPDFFINVNLSYSQLENDNFKNDVIKLLDELDFPYKNFQLELTERCKNLDIDYLKEELSFFRNKGIKVALDDFGTGTSTLRLIADLPLDCVKVDQSFVRNILDNPSNAIVVETILDCAKRLGISVCLEGVENENIKRFVSKYYANYQQGYYYSKPVLFDEFLNVLKLNWKTKGINIIRSNNKSSYDVNNILSMMPGGFFIYLSDETERIILANEALLDLYECNSMEEFIELTNQSFKGMVHPDDYERIEKEIVEQISLSEKKYDKVRYRIITKSGKIKNVIDYGHLVTKAYNDNIYYVFIAEEN